MVGTHCLVTLTAPLLPASSLCWCDCLFQRSGVSHGRCLNNRLLAAERKRTHATAECWDHALYMQIMSSTLLQVLHRWSAGTLTCCAPA